MPPREPEALARLIQLLKDQTIRRRMGHAGLDRVRRLFTVERMVAETAAVYRRGAQGLSTGSSRPLTAPIPAGVHHPDVAQREVVADGIGRIEGAQCAVMSAAISSLVRHTASDEGIGRA